MTESIYPVPQRGIAEVTNDIRIQTGMFLRTAIEIGRLLFEAKAMVEPGGWSAYIENELPFSHSWANNYMKLYKEYGSDQTSLFGDSQAFMNLRPTQALELLALPAESREEFVAAHDMEALSTRQLHQEIQKELEEARQAKTIAEDQLSSAERHIEDLEKELEGKEDDLREMALADSERQEELKDLRRQAESAKVAHSTAQKDLEKLKKQLADAEKKEKDARAELEKARSAPDIPETIMEQLRREVEADAAQRAADSMREQLDAAQKKASAYADALTQVEQKLADTQKAAKLASPDAAVFKALFEQVQTDFNKLTGLLMKIRNSDPDLAAKLTNAVYACLDSMRKAV